MTATEKLDAISKALEAGRTIYVRTHTHSTKVTPRTAARFAATGRPVFKATGNDLWMTSGRKYVCINWCRVEAH